MITIATASAFDKVMGDILEYIRPYHNWNSYRNAVHPPQRQLHRRNHRSPATSLPLTDVLAAEAEHMILGFGERTRRFIAR